MWRIDPAPKLVPDNESNLARIIRENDEAVERETLALREAEGREALAQITSRRDSIKRLVESHFGQSAIQSIKSEIDAINEMDKLNLIFDEAITTTSLEELRKVLV